MTPTVVAVLVAMLGSSAVSAIATHVLGRQRARADVAAILTTAAGTLIADLRAEVDRLTARLDASRTEADRLSADLIAARGEIAHLSAALGDARAELARLTPTPKE